MPQFICFLQHIFDFYHNLFCRFSFSFPRSSLSAVINKSPFPFHIIHTNILYAVIIAIYPIFVNSFV